MVYRKPYFHLYFLIFNLHRYLYYILRFIDAIFLTIQWRYEVYLKYYLQPDFSDIAPLIFQQLCYLSPVLDQRSRTILYFKMKNNRRREAGDLYLKLIIYMMDRY